MSLRISIIGGVAGGAGAAAAARRSNESAVIDLFEAGSYISYANCGLPYYLSGEIKTRDQLLVTSPGKMRDRFHINVHTQHEVVAINRSQKLIRVRDLAAGREFDHPFDRLVIATGAKGFRLPTEGLDHPRVSECRTVDDIDLLAGAADGHPRGRALVIGGGFIGVEVAEALTNRGMTVTLIDLAPQLLPPLDPEIAGAAQQRMEQHGVVMRLGKKVDRMSHGETESIAHLSDGEEIRFDLAVVSVGVIPETSLAKSAGLKLGETGGLVVDEHQRTDDPDIFAAGDVTELLYWPTQRRMKLALAGPANKQARVAGANAASAEPRLATSGAAGTAIVRVFDLAVAMTGLSEKAASAMKMPVQVTYTQNGHHAGYFPGAKPLLIKLIYSSDDGRVLGGQAFGEAGADKRIDVLATAIQARFTVDQLADLDLAYAPPFGAAKDPVVIAGMVASNAFHGRTHLITPAELESWLRADAKPVVIDVRSREEHAQANIAGSLSFPIDELRDSIGRIPRDQPIVVHCAVGYRGYLAERILRQHGFEQVRNLTGGFTAWQLGQRATQVGADRAP